MTGARLLLLLALAAVTLAGRASRAQLAPDSRWRTLNTEHFRVHFTPELEALARRAAANAERAYAQLAAELVEPRGPIDLVVADNVDFTNGYATTFPSNRIVVYAHPPVDQPSLRFYDEWNTLVVTHELAHIFHLDRSRGWWRFAQRVFGRNPVLFPNQYLPAWVAEGLAVYYESKLTGSGRLESTQHRALARASALAGDVPAIGALSLSTSRFPGGEVSYAYGAMLFDYLARAQGAERVGEYVETVARTPIPFLLERNARRGFGVTFDAAWRSWRDSLASAVAPLRTLAASPYYALTPPAWQAQGPRWLADSLLVYAENPGREVPGAYTVDLDGRRRRLGRRNDATPNAPLADGGLLFAQQDFVDPYRVRSDLYVARDGRQQRLTRGARLFRPDARADGAIVAGQAMPGATRLVRVSPDGAAITALTAAAVDTHWSEPRWSPDGSRIAAVRWTLGGTSEVVVLDTLGQLREVLARARAVHGAPSWAPDGRAVLYSSDSSGRAQLYRVLLRGDGSDPATAAPERLSDAATALYQPELSPRGGHVAAVRLAPDGYELVTAPLAAAPAASDGAEADWLFDRPAVPTLPVAAPSSAPARAYTPWRSLLPRYWMPVADVGDVDELFAGGATSGRDIIGRHAYTAQALVGTTTGLREYSGAYRYAGLGRPVLDAAYTQRWRRGALVDQDGVQVGELRRRTRTASLAATVVRPRVRTNAFVSAGAEVEWRDYVTSPAPLLGALDAVFRSRPTYPAVQLSAGWSNPRRPTLSISPEDGVALSGTVRQRWLDQDVQPRTRSAVGIVAAYRSLPWLPGFAHHVLAARVAGGWADDAATSEFEAGGVSGGALELLPGVVLGEGARTFGIRGVPAGARYGTRAAAATLEYRAPLAAPGRGLAPLPIFFDRASLALFADAGTAWCPAAAASRPVCSGAATRPRWLASVGAELALDLALQYDVAYRFRLGGAVPRADSAAGVAGSPQFYLTVGRAF